MVWGKLPWNTIYILFYTPGDKYDCKCEYNAKPKISIHLLWLFSITLYFNQFSLFLIQNLNEMYNSNQTEIISYFLLSMSNATNYWMLLILSSISTMKYMDFNWAEKTTTIITDEQNLLVQLAGQSNKNQ